MTTVDAYVANRLVEQREEACKNLGSIIQELLAPWRKGADRKHALQCAWCLVEQFKFLDSELVQLGGLSYNELRAFIAETLSPHDRRRYLAQELF